MIEISMGRIHPHPKTWKLSPIGMRSGDYSYTPRKRGGVVLCYRGDEIFDCQSARLAKSFAARHAAGELEAEVYVEHPGFAVKIVGVT